MPFVFFSLASHKPSFEMLSALVAGYSSSESSDEGEAGKDKEHDDSESKTELCAKEAKQGEPKAAPVTKRKLPSAASLMASTSSWAKGSEVTPEQTVDKVGTKYHHVPPPSEFTDEI